MKQKAVACGVPTFGSKVHGPVLVWSFMQPSVQVPVSFALNPNKLAGCVYLLDRENKF